MSGLGSSDAYCCQKPIHIYIHTQTHAHTDTHTNRERTHPHTWRSGVLVCKEGGEELGREKEFYNPQHALAMGLCQFRAALFACYYLLVSSVASYLVFPFCFFVRRSHCILGIELPNDAHVHRHRQHNVALFECLLGKEPAA